MLRDLTTQCKLLFCLRQAGVLFALIRLVFCFKGLLFAHWGVERVVQIESPCPIVTTVQNPTESCYVDATRRISVLKCAKNVNSLFGVPAMLEKIFRNLAPYAILEHQAQAFRLCSIQPHTVNPRSIAASKNAIANAAVAPAPILFAWRTLLPQFAHRIEVAYECGALPTISKRKFDIWSYRSAPNGQHFDEQQWARPLKRQFRNFDVLFGRHNSVAGSLSSFFSCFCASSYESHLPPSEYEQTQRGTSGQPSREIPPVLGLLVIVVSIACASAGGRYGGGLFECGYRWIGAGVMFLSWSLSLGAWLWLWAWSVGAFAACGA
jgi:hypothetical protein